MTIGDRISVIRRQRNMTQEELAEKLGVTKATISKYELGRRQLRVEQLEAIASALNTNAENLIGCGEDVCRGDTTRAVVESLLADLRNKTAALMSTIEMYESMLLEKEDDQ